MELDLPEELIVLLTDEAYATLCRTSLGDALDKNESEKQEVMPTLPPFGMLGSKSARSTFETSLKAVLDNETGIRRRIKQIDLIDPRLKADIEEGIHNFLLSASGVECKCCNEACEITDEWTRGITALHEQGVALARDARAVAGAIESTPANAAMGSKKPGATLHAVAHLRATVGAAQGEITTILEVNERFLRLISNESADAVQLPSPPEFRDLLWVDGLNLLENAEALAEIRRFETEARAFCSTGMKSLLAQAEDVRFACQEARKEILQNYWQKMRAFAMSNYVEERDVDEVLAELINHRAVADAKRAADVVHGKNPFASER